MARCVACGASSSLIAEAIGACIDCIRAGNPKALTANEESRANARREFALPLQEPKAEGGVVCGLCVRDCRIPEGEVGFCGVRHVRDGRVRGGDQEGAQLQWYHDPLPTNCVADWVCPAGTGCGESRFSYREGPEHGYTNLAVFYEACSFDCLFCQNWHYRNGSRPGGDSVPMELATATDEATACICFFGGDPGPQVTHALEASRLAQSRHPGRILRICWETNGSQSPAMLDRMLEVSMRSGGCVKFDLKAFNEDLHRVLCGVSNSQTVANFERAARRAKERPNPPPVVASTLLVPGYIDAKEVEDIAGFIAGIDPSLPYALLGFHPNFLLGDLPRTSRRHAKEAEVAARSAGLERVRIGNHHLLGKDY